MPSLSLFTRLHNVLWTHTVLTLRDFGIDDLTHPPHTIGVCRPRPTPLSEQTVVERTQRREKDALTRMKDTGNAPTMLAALAKPAPPDGAYAENGMQKRGRAIGTDDASPPLGVIWTDIGGLDEVSATMLPDPGIIHHDWSRNRRLYAALDNETPKQIAEKFNVELKQVLVDNSRLHPGLRTNAKLYTRTPIVLQWSDEGAPPKPKSTWKGAKTGQAQPLARVDISAGSGEGAAAGAADAKCRRATAPSSEPEPAAVYCYCQSPHGNDHEFRFMICCTACEEWYHGDCTYGYI